MLFWHNKILGSVNPIVIKYKLLIEISIILIHKALINNVYV